MSFKIELEQEAYWAIQTINFDLKAASEKQMLQLSELDELNLNAYKSSKIYKEQAKRWHDRHVRMRQFEEGDMVLLFNSRLRLFPSKLRS